MLIALIHPRGLFELLLEPEAQFTWGEDIGVAQELRKVYLSELFGALEGVGAGAVYLGAIRAGIISRGHPVADTICGDPCGHPVVATRLSCGNLRCPAFANLRDYFRAVGGELVVALGAILGESHLYLLPIAQKRVEVFAEHFRLVREFKVFAVERLACGVGGDSPDVAEPQ